MLIIGLIGAGFLYAVLYLLYLSADSQLSGSSSTLAIINELLFVPPANVFFLLRGLLLITLFYVIADAVLNPARRQVRNNKRRRKDEEYNKKAFRGVRAPKTPSDDDCDSDNLAPHY